MGLYWPRLKVIGCSVPQYALRKKLYFETCDPTDRRFLSPPNLFRVGGMNEDLNFLDLGAGYLADVLVYCPFYAGILSLASANGPSNKMQGWT